jgi:hypothetical protein
MAIAQVNGLEIRKFRKFNTLIEALRFMIFKGMDNPASDDNESQPTAAYLTRHTGAFVTMCQPSTSQRQHRVPQSTGMLFFIPLTRSDCFTRVTTAFNSI